MLDPWNGLLAFLAAFFAVTGLVRLMRLRRDQLLAAAQAELEAEVRRQRNERR